MLRAFFASSFALCLFSASGLAHAQSGFGGGAGVDLKSLIQGGSGGPAAASAGGSPGHEEQVDQSGAFRVVPRAFRPYSGNEFQRFIEKTLGHQLKLYGQELFELDGSFSGADGMSVNATSPGVGLGQGDGSSGFTGGRTQNPQGQQNPFGPVAATAVSGDYLIGPGDEIIVKIYSSAIDLDQRFTVSREGVIVLPGVGPVDLAGVRAANLEKRLKAVLSKTLTDFNVFATVGRLKGIDVYVVGQARNPGKYTISSMSTVISGLFATGGPNSFGSFRAIELVRAGKVVGTLDLYRFMAGGDTGQDLRLVQGDVIHIPPAGPQVALMGAIQKPAIYELAPGRAVTAVQDLLSLMGGLPVTTNPTNVILERTDPLRAKPLIASRLTLNEVGLRQPLRDGDILRFFPIKPAFSNAVTLRILDQPPVRVPINPGARVNDVIPDREALLTPSFYARRHGGASGLDVPGLPTKPVSAEFESSLKSENELKCERMGFLPSSTDMRDCQFQLEMKSIDAQARRDAQSLNGVVTGAQPYRSSASSPEPTTFASRRAQSEKDGQYQKLRERVRADEINWEQALIERLGPGALAPQLINFNLEQAVIQVNPTANIELQPGDVISVLRRKDLKGPALQSTRLVRIQGEVAVPGIYQLLANETLDQLLARAGGPSAQAYLFGTVLRRESVRDQQRDNLQQLARQLEMRLDSDQQATLSVGSAELQAAQQLIFQRNQEFKRQAVDRLKNLEPNGRVALEMDPLARGLPQLLLEDGDDILIPARPSSIQVAGSVVNENALRFREGRTLRQVVQVAGALPSADISRAFILRADGSAVLPDIEEAGWLGSRTVSRWFAHDPVQDITLMPGDTVIVPDKVVSESGYSVFVRGLKDWTQIIYQLGLSAAALNALRD